MSTPELLWRLGMRTMRCSRPEEMRLVRRRLSASLGVTFSQLAAVLVCVVMTVMIPTQNARATYWEPQLELSFDEGVQTQQNPSIAVNGTDVHVVWQDMKDGDNDIYYRRFDGISWGPEQEISVDVAVNQQYYPAVAADNGKAHVAWTDTVGGDFDIYYRYFDGSTWQPRQEISSDGASEPQRFPSIAAENGKVHIAWEDQGDGDYDIYYRHFDGTSWQSEVEISTDAGIEGQGLVSIASNGSEVHVVWADGGGGDSDIIYRHFDGTIWQAEVEISVDSGNEVQTKPSIAVFGNEVHVVWLDGEGGDYDVLYRHFDGASWQAEVEISTDTTNEAQDEPSISAEGSEVHATWADSRDGDLDIHYRHFDGASWQAEVVISSDSGVELQNCPVIAAEYGSAYVAWHDLVEGDLDIMYRPFNGTGWESEYRVSSDPSNGLQYAASLSAQGNTVHVVWHDNNDGDYDIRYRHFDGSDWQPELELSSDTGGVSQMYPDVVADGTTVHVVWQDGSDGDYDIYYRQFDGTSWLAAMELSTDSGSEGQEAPSIAAEGGRVYVVWQDWGDGDLDIYFRYFDGATWQPEQQISTDSGTEAQVNPSIVAEAGNAFVVWQDMEGGDMTFSTGIMTA